jgi:hypothetical protein
LAARDAAAQIHALVSEMHLALRVSRGDAAWKVYVARMSDRIAATLRAVALDSLRAVLDTIDPADTPPHRTPSSPRRAAATAGPFRAGLGQDGADNGGGDGGAGQKGFRQVCLRHRVIQMHGVQA